jgi:rhodanese-related sulfurtransferase
MDGFAMLPLGLDSWLVPVIIGFAFGFTLESSGFGDARRLAAQFYLTEMRVLKVMFTAIVTCMVLLAWFSAVGWLDFDKVFVNPTYLGSGIVGGLLLGLGFIIGGYCPGTSIVSAATLKIDGILFLGGVGIGSFLFGETADGFRVFYDSAGYLGRLTIPEWLGVDPGWVVLGVVVMALLAFWGAETVERRYGGGGGASRGRRFWAPAVKGGGIALAVFLLLAMALPAVGQPDIRERIHRERPVTDRVFAERSVHIDPLEMLGLMHGRVQGKIGRVRLVIIDVRSESDFNLFHLVDARRVPLEDLLGDAGRAFAGKEYEKAIKVVVSNDERESGAAFKVLHAWGAKHVYVLSGGINVWLDVFRHRRLGAAAKPDASATGTLRHEFPEALGSRYPFAKPTLQTWNRFVEAGIRPGAWKVKPPVAAPDASGGCG